MIEMSDKLFDDHKHPEQTLPYMVLP